MRHPIPRTVAASLFVIFVLCQPAAALDTAATLGLAGKYYDLGNYAKAQPLYEKLVKAEGMPATILPDVYYRLGRSYHYSNQTDSAIICFQTVSDLYPKCKIRDSARKWLGDCHVLEDRLDSAIAVYRSILQNPSSSQVVPEVKFELAATLFKIRDYDAAESEFKTFTSKYPSHILTKQAKFYLKRIQNIPR